MKTTLERFEEKINKDTYCWEWQGSLSHGYGQYSVGMYSNGFRGLALTQFM